MSTVSISNSSRFVAPLLLVALCPVAIAAPKAKLQPLAKKAAKPASAAPVSLGNGIFMLGEDTAVEPVRSSPSKPSTSKAAVVRPATRMAPINRGSALVRFCRSYLGRKLGNGQCSELAVLGLPAVGAQLDFNNRWGAYVCDYIASGGRRYIQVGGAGQIRGNANKANIKPGDIIQYENVKFEQHWSDGRTTFQEYPHHTSIVEQVSRDGNTIKVLEQNVNNTQFVVETQLDLPSQTQGSMRITRPLAR